MKIETDDEFELEILKLSKRVKLLEKQNKKLKEEIEELKADLRHREEVSFSRGFRSVK